MEVKAGDVIEWRDGGRDYVLGRGDELGTNAVNLQLVDEGLVVFGEEVYPLERSDFEDFDVIGHFGEGRLSDAQKWYEKNREFVK